MEFFKVVTFERKSVCDLFIDDELRDLFVKEYKKGDIVEAPTIEGIWCFKNMYYAEMFIANNLYKYPNKPKILKVKGFNRKRQHVHPLLFKHVVHAMRRGEIKFEKLKNRYLPLEYRTHSIAPGGTVRFQRVEVLT